ncbi:MAG: hypothetical protein JWM80_5566 [Cyanobacteria bacterium RYN_339]|nr:hypothetical protein [Cyanobacteria bacterium RYN_339]
MATTINNATPQVAGYKAPASSIPSIPLQPVQVGQIGSPISNDQLLIRQPVRPFDPSQFFKPTTQELQGNVMKASLEKNIAENRVAEAQKAYDEAKSPIEKFVARQSLNAAKDGLQEATVKLDKANVALDQRKADDADKAVAAAEKAVQNASNPFTRMLAIKQLEGAVKAQTKAQDALNTAKRQLVTDEFAANLGGPIMTPFPLIGGAPGMQLR